MLMVWKSLATRSHASPGRTSVSHEDAAPVHKRPQARVGLLQRHEEVFAEPELEVLVLESAEAREVVGDGVLAENVIVDEDGEVARETGDAAQLQIGLLPHDAVAVGRDIRLGDRGEARAPVRRRGR